MSFPFGETVVIHRRTGATQDGDGNDVPAYTDETIDGAVIYPRGASIEVVDNGDTVKSGLTVVFIPPIALNAVDRVTARGDQWDIDGDDEFFHSPRSGVEVTRISLKKVTG